MPGVPDHEQDELSAVTSLAEPTRRALYEFVARRGGWVGRDEAAEGTGIERGTAAHHLDRLTADGLLEVEFRRLTGRQGPGAGRPAKLYRRARREFDVSLPPREYEIAGRLLAEAADSSRADRTDITSAVEAAARAEGRELAGRIASRLHGVTGRRAAERRRAALDVLAEFGYEPAEDADGTVILRNCPFHRLAERHTELICGMNLCLLDATIDTLGRTGLHAELDPEDGLCCVKLRPRR